MTLIDAEPIKIDIDPKAKPVAVKSPALVPLHFKEEVTQGLMEDVHMGILEKVPLGEKTTWQHRMHVVSKPDGRPRRTVDLRSLNKVCKKDVHFVNPPYKQAREIPRRQLKTATDAWNGYHSCPLDVESWPLTTFVTDWSMVGIGYWMYQKTCDCPFDPVPNKCCTEGWRVTFANSRPIKPAEWNYWPTEGEALGVAWALEDSKYFSLGCNDLHVTTDHRPLVSLLGSKDLSEIDNRRLVSFKERTFPWAFQIHYVEGAQNAGPDFISRNPAKDEEDEYVEFAAVTEEIEEVLAATVKSDLMEAKAVTWERVVEETIKDETLEKLKELARSGFPEDREKWPELARTSFRSGRTSMKWRESCCGS